jgi:RNA polymerase sigma-70 factor (ECF subfamily)
MISRRQSETPAAGERQQLDLLLAGDPRTFNALVQTHQDTMLRLASYYVPTRELAEEAVQETWAAVLEGLPRFEGRSSLRTWIFAILINRAKSLGVRERRMLPLSALGSGDSEEPPDETRHEHEEQTPERALLVREELREVGRNLQLLPRAQGSVVTLMGVLGRSSRETCRELDISPANQRVLLHRGRSKLRALAA